MTGTAIGEVGPPSILRVRDLRGTRAWSLGVGFAAAVAICVVVVVLRARHHEVLVGDEARLALQSLDAIANREHLGVLTTAGQYTGRDLHNPGPVQLYTLLPFVRAFGIDVGAWLYCVAVIGLSGVVAWWATFRSRGWWPAAAVAITFPLMLLTTNPGGLTHVLNDELVLAPVFACWILAWAVAGGDVWMVPVLAVTSTYVVQTFVGDAILVLAPIVVAVAACGWTLRRVHRWSQLGRVGGLTAALLAVLWLLPALDEVRHTHNLSGLLSLSIPGRGLSSVWSSLGAILGSPWTDATGRALLHPPSATSLALAAGGLVVVVVAVLWCRRPGLEAWVVPIVSGVVVGAACITAALDPPSDTATYHFFWARATWWLLVLSFVVVTGPALRRLLVAGQGPGLERALIVGCPLAVVAFVVSVAGAGRQAPAIETRRVEAELARHLSSALEARMPSGATWQILARDGYIADDIAQGIRAELRQAGRRLDDGFATTSTAPAVLLAPGEVESSGRAIASIPSTARGAVARFPADVVELVRPAGRLTLTPSGSSNLTHLIDGRLPALCAHRLRSSPAALAALPSTALATLFSEGDVASPVMPDALVALGFQWRVSESFALYAVRRPPPYRIDHPLLSTSC